MIDFSDKIINHYIVTKLTTKIVLKSYNWSLN